MHQRVHFIKVSGSGNDFVLVDNMDRSLNLEWGGFARAVCSRHFGVGGDGLLTIEPGTRTPLRMNYFNADGSFGGMCGNGGRCVARYAQSKGIAGQRMQFEALGHVYSALVEGPLVTLYMIDVRIPPRRLRFSTQMQKNLDGFFLENGSPHVVIECPNVESVEVMNLGRKIRYDSLTAPEGANVNFYTPRSGSSIDLRTYERGVESETLACGTGAVAAAMVASWDHSMRPPISVGVRSGETLVVNFNEADGIFENVTLQGSAHFLFSGVVVFDTEDGTIKDILSVGG